ncbi:MAG: hypothetical protein WCL51_13550 [Bacteroidota bacterium]
MKKFTVVVFVLFFLTSTIYNMYGQSTNLTTLVNERRNMFQELQYNVKTKAQTINHKNYDNFFNDITRLDDKISDEVHRVDSIVENSARLVPVMNSTIENLRTKKDTAMMYFYILLLIAIASTLVLISITVKFQQQKKKLIFLNADIEGANDNYSRVSDEKLSLQKEMKATLKSFENTLENVNKEIELITIENTKLKNELVYFKNNEDNPDIIFENRLLKEAIVELENKKNDYEKKLNEYEIELENKNKELEEEIENRKHDKRIIIGTPDETTEIIKRELAKRIDYLENALKAKEIMEGILAKKNREMELRMTEISENYNLLLSEFEEEKGINTKLNNKLDFLEEELTEKDKELKDVWSKVSNHADIPKDNSNSNDSEANVLRTLEKLSRLRQADILNESEFAALKDKIINQM